MLDNLFHLANAGVEIFRLDAAPYIWKRLGTTSRGQPEAFAIIRAFRAFLKLVAPGVILKAEAIVPSRQLAKYVEADQDGGGTCQLAYNATLMTALWDALATGGVANFVRVVNNNPRINPDAAWLTYVRCHDDIGWSIFADDLAAAGGEEASASAARLQNFFSGDGTFAEGARYQETGSVGATASLCGLGRALAADDEETVDKAIARMLALYTAIYAYGGTPLINMGDEVGIRNYKAYRDDPRYDGDNRWLHRAFMPWSLIEHGDPVARRLLAGFERLAACRAASTELDGSEAVCAGSSDSRVLLLSHRREGGEILVAVNFSDHPASFDVGTAAWRDLLADSQCRLGAIALPPYGCCWLKLEGAQRTE
jgi:amylosucrase